MAQNMGKAYSNSNGQQFRGEMAVSFREGIVTKRFSLVTNVINMGGFVIHHPSWSFFFMLHPTSYFFHFRSLVQLHLQTRPFYCIFFAGAKSLLQAGYLLIRIGHLQYIYT